MAAKCTIIRYSEIALKGKNRNMFENRLVDNIKHYLKRKNIEFVDIIKTHSRIILISDDKPDLKPIFGISSYSHAEFFEYDYQALVDNCVDLAREVISKNDTFRVSVQRIDKRIKKKSIEMEREIGEAIVNELQSKVSLKEFDKEIGIELIEGKSYVFEGREEGFNGLPLGVDDSSSLLVEDKNSILAGLMMLRRGIFFKNIYLVGDQDISLLEEYMNVDKKYKILQADSRADGIRKAIEEGNHSLTVNDLIHSIDDIKEKNLLILRPLIYLKEKEAAMKLREFER